MKASRVRTRPPQRQAAQAQQAYETANNVHAGTDRTPVVPPGYDCPRGSGRAGGPAAGESGAEAEDVAATDVAERRTVRAA